MSDNGSVAPTCGAETPAPRGLRQVAGRQELLKGVWRENPVLIQLLGLCPTLAVTNSVANAVVMGVATFFVLVGSSVLVSLLKRLIPNEVRISTYILIIATFVSVAEMALQALVPGIYKALGAFVALIVVNCIILGRQEAFAGKHSVGRSVLDAIGMGFGFIITMLIMGTIREVIGSGTFLGVPLFGARYEPWVVMVLPPGGFLTLAAVLLTIGWARRRRAQRAATAEVVDVDALVAERTAS
jgi:electron transport complex protein RnfE